MTLYDAGGSALSRPARTFIDPAPVFTPRPAWHQHAACRGMDPDLFFPTRGEDVQQAQAVCRTCPVAEECLGFALQRGEKFGVWGGKSERARRRMRTRLFAARTERQCVACGTRFLAERRDSWHCSDDACRRQRALLRQRRYLARRKGLAS